MEQQVDQPYAVATIRDNGDADIVISGNSTTLSRASVDQARDAVVIFLTHRARPLGAPIRAVVDEPDGRHDIVVNPDGSVTELVAAPPVPPPLAPHPASDPGPAEPGPPEHTRAEPPEHDTIPPGQRPPAAGSGRDPGPNPATAWGPPDPSSEQPPSGTVPLEPTPPMAPWAAHNFAQPDVDGGWPVQRAPVPPSQPGPAGNGWPTGPAAASPWTQGHGTQPQVPQQVNGWPQQPQQPGQPMTRRQMRESFLKAEQTEAPATAGLRGTLSRLGVRVQPSAAERAERDDVHAVSQHWPGVRTIAIANGKGGSGKTPTTALLAATFARYSGAATIAWDNNETRGTLGWRTEQGKHDATVLDLIPRTAELLEPGARAGDISHYVHHQAADKYDVLRSNPNLLSAEQRISTEDVDAIHDVLGRYYRMIFVDSGNDESAPHWLRMIDKADQLVVPTVARPEHAEAGALLLEELTKRGGRSAELAQGAVVIVSQAREKDVNPSAADIARGFEGWVSDVVTIPYDRAMVESVLRFDSLAPATRRAWLRAAAAVARRL